MALVTAVITTCRREPEMVERALLSIIAQTHRPLEIFIVDDSPADYALRPGVAALAEKYADRGVRYFPHEKNKGACAARNTGLSNASGEFIAFLDDDDEWMPEKTERQLSLFDRDEVGFVYCGRYSQSDDDGSRTAVYTKALTGHQKGALLEENFVGSTSYVMMRTSALRKIGGFDEEMLSSQDCDAWVRLAEQYELGFTDEPLAIYHTHTGERITTNPKKKISGIERLIEKNQQFFSEHPKALWTRLIALPPFYAADGKTGKALRVWLRAVAKRPTAIGKNFYILWRTIKAFLIRHKNQSSRSISE